jgi:hypothetical protein
MTNPLRSPLENLLSALSPLTVMGHGIAALDSNLGLRITEAVQALNEHAEPADIDTAVQLAVDAASTVQMWEPAKLHRDFAAEAVRQFISIKGAKPEPDQAYCIGCGTYPKGPYTCATCAAADEHEGPQPHVSDWPVRC